MVGGPGLALNDSLHPGVPSQFPPDLGRVGMIDDLPIPIHQEGHRLPLARNQCRAALFQTWYGFCLCTGYRRWQSQPLQRYRAQDGLPIFRGQADQRRGATRARIGAERRKNRLASLMLLLIRQPVQRSITPRIKRRQSIHQPVGGIQACHTTVE